jgi:hypothetical protein
MIEGETNQGDWGENMVEKLLWEKNIISSDGVFSHMLRSVALFMGLVGFYWGFTPT